MGLALTRQPTTICARRTNEYGMLCERTIERSCRRSASLIISVLFGLPTHATRKST